MSKPYAEVIGDPIAHSKSPVIHGFWLERLGIDAEYRACHVLPAELGNYLARCRQDPDWHGCNVTIPHKQAVMPFLDRLDARAEKVGAVNTVFRDRDNQLSGTNTDVDGVYEAVRGSKLQERRVTVIGAGGAARAAFAYLSEAGCAAVKVLARSPDRARAAVGDCGLQAQILPFAPESGAFMDATLVINATQLGMTGQPPMPDFVLDELSMMANDALVFDMVYAPLETELLKAASRCGYATSDGLVMLVGQAATAFECFFGIKPPREEDTQLRARLLA